MINQLSAEDTTAFEWCPDSEHIVTASCSPRLKVDNGYKVWHYARGVVHQADIKELWEVKWQPAPPGTFPERPIERVSQKAAAAAAAVKGVYRPPGARGTDGPTLKLHELTPAQNAQAVADAKVRCRHGIFPSRVTACSRVAPARVSTHSTSS
jgi:translation initiation factor 2A